MSFCGRIYAIHCRISGKVYIGQTTKTIQKRWASHLRDFARFASGDKSTNYCTALYRAMAKYGTDQFVIEQIDELYNEEDYDNSERFYIQFWDCIAPKGYNLTSGGRNGWTYSKEYAEETRKKAMEGVARNLDNFRKSEEAKGLPMYVRLLHKRTRGGKAIFMIEGHPLFPTRVNFGVGRYDDDFEAAKAACLDLLRRVEESGVPYVPPTRERSDLPRGLRPIDGGYRVKKQINNVLYIKEFRGKDGEALERAKTYLDKLIKEKSA